MKPLNQLIYIFRHGETDYNRARIVQGSGIDSDLNEVGWDQACMLYQFYKDLSWDLVMCSALKRSFQTIKYFSDQAPILRFSDLNEISWGDQEGKKSSPETFGYFRNIVDQWSAGDIHARLPYGESANELFIRMTRVKTFLNRRSEANIIVCTHGRAMRALLCVLFNQPASAMELYKHDNTACYIVGKEVATYTLLKANNTEHLK